MKHDKTLNMAGHLIVIEEVYATFKGEQEVFGYVAKCTKCHAQSAPYINRARLRECFDDALAEVVRFPCCMAKKLEPSENCEYCNDRKPMYIWHYGAERRFIIEGNKMKVIEEGITQPFPPWITIAEFTTNYCPICGKELSE